MDALAGCGKTPRLPFDKLRANGAGVENIGDFPFMLSPSKHEKSFFRTLLGVEEENIRSEVSLVHDLGAESIDLLDIGFSRMLKKSPFTLRQAQGERGRC